MYTYTVTVRVQELCESRGGRPGFSVLTSLTLLSACIKGLQHVTGIRIVQELCESRGGRPGLSVLTSLLVSVDVKTYCTVLRHWSQLVPNMSHDI